jgi:hypothetical protein
MIMTSAYIWPILVASIAAFGIGALWYSPILFGRQWMALVKMTDADAANAKERGVAKLYVAQFIATAVTFAAMAFIIRATGSDTAKQGIFIACLVWLGFPVMSTIGDMLWQKKPLKLAMISLLGTLVSWIVGGAIIGAWR